MKKRNKIYLLGLLLIAGNINRSVAQQKTDSLYVSNVWVADNGDGTYKNPVLHADYSDPDAIRVGTDFYMTASSFNCIPGLPILHSKDLVNWNLIGYALQKQPPFDVYDKPQHGNGVWAPCIRYHDGEYYIFYPDPDYGIYMIKAQNPKGPWSEPLLIKAGKGLIDPSPLWDDDGNPYLVHAFAGSRAGVKSVLMVSRMKPDGTELIGNEVMVYDGHKNDPTVEGPKFYKRHGYYYIFAPAGGVPTGWQVVLRSKNVFGPYERRMIMAQGSTAINGPHQGAWVETPDGQSWFLHFQDKEAYGRDVLLEPMTWKNDWPVIGIDKNGDGVGEPVQTWKKPDVGRTYPIVTPPESDEFNKPTLGLQWQWHANPQVTWGFPSGRLGFYRLNCIPKPDGFVNLWSVPNLLLQKFPAEEFMVTTKLTFHHRFDGEEVGLVVMGEDYQYIKLEQENKQLMVKTVSCHDARKGNPEKEIFQQKFTGPTAYFRVKVREGAVCNFSFSADGKNFTEAGEKFHAVPGRWIGAKVGLFALRNGKINDAGNADVDWFRIEKIEK